MKLNAKKCKEMRICFLKDPIEFPHLKIDNQQLELEICVKTLKKISRGGPRVKHLPMTSQHMHYYQTRGANKYSCLDKGCPMKV